MQDCSLPEKKQQFIELVLDLGMELDKNLFFVYFFFFKYIDK